MSAFYDLYLEAMATEDYIIIRPVRNGFMVMNSRQEKDSAIPAIRTGEDLIGAIDTCLQVEGFKKAIKLRAI